MSTIPRRPLEGALFRTLPEAAVGALPPNPAPFDLTGQQDAQRIRTLADTIVSVFLNSLPSNYVSESRGPYYVQQFQAAAEALARIQILATDAYEDADFDFTRSEVLNQFLETLVFPDAAERGTPELAGDVTYRAFLKRMVALLLQGARHVTLVQGLEELTEAEVALVARGAHTESAGVAWRAATDQFVFDVEISRHRRTSATAALGVADHYHPVAVTAAGQGIAGAAVYASGSGPAHTHSISNFVLVENAGTGQVPHTHALLSDYAELPLVLERNVALVLGALDPAHALYTYRNLFREVLRSRLVAEQTECVVDSAHYDDTRFWWGGVAPTERTTGTVRVGGYDLNDRVGFDSVARGARLEILAGPLRGVYRVEQVLRFPYGDDPTPRLYTTSPTGLTGTAIVQGDVLYDAAANWATAVAGEVLTLSEGPNAGLYRLDTITGNGGGPVGAASGPGTRVRPALGWVRVNRRLATAATNVRYRVEHERLGRAVTRLVVDEDISTQFHGSSGTISTGRVARGPLVTAEGAPRPATARDLRVAVDGVAVTVSGLNPYTGQFTLASGVAAFSPGAHVVTASYAWHAAPRWGMAALNTLGVTLNTWVTPTGLRLNTATGSGRGVVAGGRFPMSLGLNPESPRRQPQRVAWRYTAAERLYTAALNSPLTLRLNETAPPPSVPYATVTVEPVAVAYRADLEIPPAPWARVGAASDTQIEGAYQLTATRANEVAYWRHPVELPVPHYVTVAARWRLNSAAPLVTDGVYGGVGVGVHNNRRLYYAGLLRVTNPVTSTALYHAGLLLRPGLLAERSSWDVGPRVLGTVIGTRNARHVRCATADLPSALRLGGRFQILSGGQTGIYTLETYRTERDGTTLLQVAETFPADARDAGCGEVTLYFEVDVTQWTTWRVEADLATGVAQVFLGGIEGGVLRWSSQVPVSPASLGPDLLPGSESGALVWGNLSRVARSTSAWQGVWAVARPTVTTNTTRGTLLDTTLSRDPEDEEWYRLAPWGDSALQGGTLRMTATAAVASLNTVYGYGYTDPFLNGRRSVALEARVQVLRDTSGAGGVALELTDTVRRVRCGTVAWRDFGTSGKVLHAPQTRSLVGAASPSTQGWTATTTAPYTAPVTRAAGARLEMQSSATPWQWVATPGASSGTGFFVEFRVQFNAVVAGGTGRVGWSVVGTGLGRQFSIDFLGNGSIAVRATSSTTPLFTATSAWTLGVAATYRLVFAMTGSTVTLYRENVSVGSGSALSLPLAPSGWPEMALLAQPDSGTPASSFSASLEALTAGATDDGFTIGRTWGILVGDDPSRLDSWVVPRNDGYAVPNSHPDSDLVVMDWTASLAWVRVLLDPTYGVALLRPDLNPPPGYGGAWATQSLDPSAAWARVEYSRLPRAPTTARAWGGVAFGALNAAASSLSVWDFVRYRVFTHLTTDYSAPPPMVLNRHARITSGEAALDRSPEVVTVAALTPRRISLRPVGMNVGRVFAIRYEGVLLDADTWRFDAALQEVYLLGAPLPEAGVPVEVTFAVRPPYTETYLRRQPLDDSPVLLNERTPPQILGRASTATLEVVSGSGGGTPAFPPSAGPSDLNYFLRDPRLVLAPTEDPSVLYEQLSVWTEEDGGARALIASASDEAGLTGVGVSGGAWAERLPSTTVTAPFSAEGSGVLWAAGGTSSTGSWLGPALYVTPYTVPDPARLPRSPGVLPPTWVEGGAAATTELGARQTLRWTLQMGRERGSVLTGAALLPYVDAPLADTMGARTDRTYATAGPAPLSPGATGASTGAAWARVDYATPYSRLGPWGGAMTLGERSRLYGTSSVQPEGAPPEDRGFRLEGGGAAPLSSAPTVTVL